MRNIKLHIFKSIVNADNMALLHGNCCPDAIDGDSLVFIVIANDICVANYDIFGEICFDKG